MVKKIGDYTVKQLETGEIVVTSETLQSGTEIEISFKAWNEKRYYVTRGREQIGWIAMDYSKAEGKTSTNNKYVNWMLAAIKQF